jgi:glycosyltransferase involved in cell wall biosynthesis
VAFECVEGFSELGHEVTLFAPQTAHTSAKHHVPTLDSAIVESRMDARLAEDHHIAQAMELARTGEFDVMHSHLHVHALGYSRFLPLPLVSTLHGVAWNRATHPLLGAYREQPFVSISDAERRFLPNLNYVGTVYNGINTGDFELQTVKEDYLLFAGRLAPEKAPDLAIEVSRRAEVKLLIAGDIEPRYQGFFDAEVKPHLGPNVEYLGSQPRSSLAALLGKAKGLLMPLRWDEPFGLVVVEALVSGTPVIGWKRGALPELIEHGTHGFLVSDVAQAVTAVGRLSDLDPRAARSHVEQRFSRRAMSESYLDVFARLLSSRPNLN